MPALLALVPAVLLLLAGPASAQESGPADVGFPIAMLVLAVVAVVFALVWRAVSKRRSNL